MISDFTRRRFLHGATTAGVLGHVALATDPAVAREERLAPVRRANFDAAWRFSRGDFPGADAVDYSDADWQHVDVPHDWSVYGPFDEHAPCGGNGGYLPTGIGWYRKRFTLSPSHAGKRVRLEFDGIYQRSEVWINGHALGMRPYGFITFGYDVTPYLSAPGQPNVVAVRVDNSLQPNCRWYSGSGIYRHVWLVTTEPVHLAPWGIYVRTPEADGDRATVDVDTHVVNDGAAPARCTLDTAIHDPDGRLVQTASATIAIAPGSDHRFVQRLSVPKPALWSLDTPVLYSVRTIVRGGGGTDSELTPFGIRTIAFDVNRGFLLNGRHVKLNGVCLHGDAGAVGTAVPERMWEARLATLKAMGCTAIRCSHNPPAPEFLDLCDRIGLLVMDEAFDEWRHAKGGTPDYGYHKYFDEWARRDLSDMMLRDRNHPSIVIWSAGNEIVDQLAPEGTATLATLKGIIRSFDPRPVTAACDQIAADPASTPPEFLAGLDVVGYNYVDRWRDRREKYYGIDRYEYPKRLFIGTESVAMSGPRGVYTPQPAKGYRGYPENRRIAVEQLQKFIQTWDYVSGDFIWTGIDYIGESRWPNKSSSAGMIDTCGFPKDGYHFYKSLWSDETVLHLFPHWNWTGHEGETIRVSCYTNCDTVELFLNGRSLGTKGFDFPQSGMTGKYDQYPPRAQALETTADLHLAWDVPYAPGTLKALGVRAGKPASTVKICTTGAPAALRLTADRAQIAASAADVSHVKVEVVDAQGRMVPTASNEISFTLAGAGRIIGVDNGQPDSHDSYKGSGIHAFNGLALAILQSRGRPGTMTLSATSPGLSSATVDISGS